MPGRKRKLDRPVGWYVKIPTSVFEAVLAELRDPVTGRTPLGSKSELTTLLLRRWLQERNTPVEPMEEDMLNLEEFIDAQDGS